MRHIIAALSASAALIASAASPALAQSFDGDDVEAFMAATRAMEALQGKYPEEELRAQVPGGAQDMAALLDEDGEFAVFAHIAEQLGSADGPIADDFEAAVTGSGFASTETFGRKADAIMMAYIAAGMDGGEMAEMAAFDPAMMAMMPPAMQAQMKPVMALMEAIGSVPPEDVRAITPYKDRLDAMMR